jgi:hypothetical protein
VCAVCQDRHGFAFIVPLSPHRDLNPGPTAYEAAALPSELHRHCSLSYCAVIRERSASAVLFLGQNRSRSRLRAGTSVLTMTALGEVCLHQRHPELYDPHVCGYLRAAGVEPLWPGATWRGRRFAICQASVSRRRHTLSSAAYVQRTLDGYYFFILTDNLRIRDSNPRLHLSGVILPLDQREGLLVGGMKADTVPPQGGSVVSYHIPVSLSNQFSSAYLFAKNAIPSLWSEKV